MTLLALTSMRFVRIALLTAAIMAACLDSTPSPCPPTGAAEGPPEALGGEGSASAQHAQHTHWARNAQHNMRNTRILHSMRGTACVAHVGRAC